jgi:hypothetical protein
MTTFSSTIDFLHGPVESAIIRYQSRVSNLLTSELRWRCFDRGVPYGKLEILLCVTIARYELLPARLELMRKAATGDPRSIRDLERVELRLKETNIVAARAGPMLGTMDYEEFTPPEILEAVAITIEHFKEGRPSQRRRLRDGVGLPRQRLRATKKDARPKAVRTKAAEKKTAQRAAYGYFAAEMAARFRTHGYGPCDDLIADLLNCVSVYASTEEVQRARIAYLKRTSVS